MDASVVPLIGLQSQRLLSPPRLGDLDPCCTSCARSLINDDQAGDGACVWSGEQRCTFLPADTARFGETGRPRSTGSREGQASLPEPREEVADQVRQPEPVAVTIPTVVEV